MTDRPPSEPLAGDALRRRYRERLPERISALEDALARLSDGEAAAEGELREMAHLLRGSGTSYGHPEITARATRTEDAPVGALEEEGRALVAELRRALQADTLERPVVLVVEDDPEIRYLLEVVLGDGDREVVTVDRGADARTVLEARPVDLVVLDLVLPDSDGRRLLRQIRERPATARVPVLVVSGHEGRAVQAECFRLGADAYFRKPFDPETLGAAVATHVARAAGRDTEARRDPRTGLLNSAGLREAWEGVDGGGPTSLALVELDGFDGVEVRHGWSVAEAALKAAASAIEEAVADAGRVGRWEGETFVVLFLDGEEGARSRVEAALERIRRTPVRAGDGESFRLTASAGIGSVLDGEDGLDEVMDTAREGVFRARAAGGNGIGGEPVEGARRRRVLVAEDDDITASLLRHRLERDGFEVEWHSNGADAFEAAMRSHPDLIVLDVRMPGMDGFELLERLRKVAVFRDVPVVLLTSMGSEGDLVRGFRLGADDYVLKPFSPTEFVARIRRLVSRRP